MKKRILLLSASAGAGHVRAAEALAKVFKTHSAVELVEHWDMLKYTNGVFRHLYSKLYLDLVNKAPAVLGWVYDLADKPLEQGEGRVVFEKLNSGRFIKAVRKFNPDLVVCTHFTPAAVLSWLCDHGQLHIVPAVVVTDLDCHSMWLVRRYLNYFVALEETRVYLEQVGVEGARVEVTGIPIDPLFEQPLAKEEARAALGLSSGLFTVLVSAGGYGVGPVERLLRSLMSISLPAQLVVIAGRSEELRSKLEAIAKTNTNPQLKVHVVGFTTQMDQFMAAADILVGKAGGLTSSEALARGLPLCIVNPIPGQEERNSDHLLEEGAAVRCNNLPCLAWKIETLMRDGEKLSSLKANAIRIGRPGAARRIVESLLS